MIKSRCHRAEVWVYSGNEGTSFYVCSYCDIACDVMCHGNHKEDSYDTGREAETKRTFVTA